MIKKANHRFLIIVLILLTLFTSSMACFAEWQGVIPDWWVYRFNTITSKEYISGVSPYRLTIGTNNKHSTLVPLRFGYGDKFVGIEDSSKINSYELTLNTVKSMRYHTDGMGNGGIDKFKDPGKFVLDNKKHDYFLPYEHMYKFTYDNGKKTDEVPVWMMLIIGRKIEEQTKSEEVKYLWDVFIKAYEDLENLSSKIKKQGQPKKAGDYHPRHAGFLDNVGRELNVILNSGWNADPRLESIEVFTATMYNPKEFDPNLKREQIEALIQTSYKTIDYVESHKVNEPEILEIKLGKNSGVIDKENKKVKLYLPDGTTVDKKDLEIITPDWVVAKFKTGDFDIGKSAVYTIEALDALHERFEDVKDYNVKEDWTIEFIEGESKKLVNSARYTSEDGKQVQANISEDKINLDIPFGVDLTKFSFEIYHTAENIYYIDKDGKDIEFNNKDLIDVSKALDIKLKSGDKEKIYTLNISSNKSKENKILSFKVNEVLGKIDQDKEEIIIALPYETDFTKISPNIELSYRATISPKAYELQDYSKGPVEYTVTSEDGSERKYRVELKIGKASSENDILSFKIGTIESVIEGNNISLKMPKGTNLENLKNLKPTITISESATISPESGESVDLSKGYFNYTVKAQDSTTKDWKVKVTLDGGNIVIPNEEYLKELKTIRDNINNRYLEEASDDWEWMNLGFYQGKENGVLDGTGIRKTFSDIPYRFNIYKKISDLNPVKQTDFGRFVMTLTAMGIDASNLTPLQDNGKPFKIRGEEVIDLVEKIYSFPVDTNQTTVNDQIFALIALDMGNYSVPADARYSREFMIDYILKHKYGTDGFGIDMVGMLMQSLYPYQDDPVYGERVKEKLEEGMNIILGHTTVPKVNPMRKQDFLFDAWGDVNSESTDQVIIALCSMGIDPYSDINFSRSKNDNMINNWINKFVTPAKDRFGHTNNKYNPMATYQGMYSLQWYINFLENGSKPYSLYKDGVTFNFGMEFSSEAEIEFFQLLGKEGIINQEKGTVKIELPADISNEELKSQAPSIILSKGAKIIPNIGENMDFNQEVIYKVTAEDGKATKDYTIIIDKKDGIKSGKKEIKNITVEGFENTNINIDQQNKKISIVLPSDTNIEELKNLKLSTTHTGASIVPLSEEIQDFSNGEVLYTVTALDGTQEEYKVKVTIKKEEEYKFTKFVLRGVEGKINTISNEIKISLPWGTFVEDIRPNKIEYEPYESTTHPVPGLTVASDFTPVEGVKYTITPYPIDNKVEYMVIVDYKDSSGSSKINSFSLGNYKAKIEDKTIILNLPEGISKDDLLELTPTIDWSGKTIDPDPQGKNNSMEDFLKDYVLTDEHGNVNKYDVKIIESSKEPGEKPLDPGKDKPSEETPMAIESFSISGNEGQIDNSSGRIYIELPYELDLYNLSPIIKVSKGSSIYPSSGQALNLRRSAKFILSNGKKTKEYVLIITIAEPKPSTKLWKYIKDNDDTVDYQVVY